MPVAGIITVLIGMQPFGWEKGRVAGDWVSASGVMGGDPGTHPPPSHLSPSPTPGLHPAPTQEVDAAEIQVQVCLYAFDLIYLNGEVSSSIVSRVVGG